MKNIRNPKNTVTGRLLIPLLVLACLLSACGKKDNAPKHYSIKITGPTLEVVPGADKTFVFTQGKNPASKYPAYPTKFPWNPIHDDIRNVKVVKVQTNPNGDLEVSIRVPIDVFNQWGRFDPFVETLRGSARFGIHEQIRAEVDTYYAYPPDSVEGSDEGDANIMIYPDGEVGLVGTSIDVLPPPKPAIVTVDSWSYEGRKGSEFVVLFFNRGMQTLELTNVSVKNNGDRVVFALGQGGRFSVPAEMNGYISVSFAPPSAGTYYGTLIIESNDPDHSPVNVALTAYWNGESQ